jgi:hypothetical protein
METQGNNKPDYIAYVVEDRPGSDKGFWHKIGSAWNQKNGKGLNLKLHANPLDGRVVLMPNDRDADRGDAGEPEEE